MSPTTSTPRPLLRVPRDLASFVDPGPAGDLVRLDGRRWRVVIGEALEVATDPHKRPDDVRLAVAQILWLAEKADDIVKEIFRD